MHAYNGATKSFLLDTQTLLCQWVQIWMVSRSPIQFLDLSKKWWLFLEQLALSLLRNSCLFVVVDVKLYPHWLLTNFSYRDVMNSTTSKIPMSQAPLATPQTFPVVLVTEDLCFWWLSTISWSLLLQGTIILLKVNEPISVITSAIKSLGL